MGVSIQLQKFGAPENVVSVVELEDLNPDQGEVVIDLEAANINPSDCLTVRGMYGILPKQFPAALGNEGVGRVSKIGEGVSDKLLGKRVSLPMGGGIWSSQLICPADKLLPLPDELPAEQLAMALINPPTAYLLLTSVLNVPKGGWVIQNAANSNVGQAVNAFAKDLGINIINLVRSDSAASTLQGCDHVLHSTDPQLNEKVKQLIGEEKAILGLDAIGGDATMQLADLLSRNGTIASYGALSGHACKLAPHHTIFKGIKLQGFWLVNWFNTATPQDFMAMSARVGGKIADGSLNIPVEATYPLEDAVSALQHAERPSRTGKILFKG